MRLLIAAGTLQLTENPVAWILPDIVVVHGHLQNLVQDIVDDLQCVDLQTTLLYQLVIKSFHIRTSDAPELILPQIILHE